MASTMFRLETKPGSGVTCDATGLFVGAAPLLERALEADGVRRWRPRPLANLNADLSRLFGLPVDLARKLGGLAAIGRDLDHGDLIHAQIAALHLRLPDPPPLAKSAMSTAAVTELAALLAASGLLKTDWDPEQHPRWPAKSPDRIGGRFAPKGADAESQAAAGETDRTSAGQSTGANRDAARTVHFQTTVVDRDGTISGNFVITPPSKVGGAIVQKVTFTQRIFGEVVRKTCGWEAWIVPPGGISPEDNGVPNDVWRAPPRSPSGKPSDIVLTAEADATFYEGLTRPQLIDTYGFTVGGSGFSDELLSRSGEKGDPGIPPLGASAVLKRTKTFSN